ncbi:MAG TPA: hypothetical protein VGD99_20100 [Anaerolineae bacterium]|jgi:hypothetical protein
MRSLQLKANYKVIQNYYQEINNLAQLSLFSEGAVSPAFAGQFSWTLAEQYTLKRSKRTIRAGGALLDPFKLLYWVRFFVTFYPPQVSMIIPHSILARGLVFGVNYRWFV